MVDTASLGRFAVPAIVPNQFGSDSRPAEGGRTFTKFNPATGEALCQVARSSASDVREAVARAQIGRAHV